MNKNTINKLLLVLAITLTVVLFVRIVYIFMPLEANNDSKFGNSLFLFSAEEYHQFMATCPDLPDDFVTPEMLSCIGKVYRLIFYDVDNPNNYRYLVKHESGVNVAFDVREYPRQSYTTIPFICLEHKYMDNLTKDLTGHYDSYKIRYHYTEGYLTHIEWTANGKWYSMNCLRADKIFGKLRSTSKSDQQAGLDMFPDPISDADPILFADTKGLTEKIVSSLLFPAFFICWYFVKVRRPVWYKEGMRI